MNQEHSPEAESVSPLYRLANSKLLSALLLSAKLERHDLQPIAAAAIGISTKKLTADQR
jgi:hypothetical protein